jgi:hypothetical protein
MPRGNLKQPFPFGVPPWKKPGGSPNIKDDDEKEE